MVISVRTEITDDIDESRRPLWLLTPRRHILLQMFIASVWLYHGLFNKLLHLSPRHLLIIQSIPVFAGSLGRWLLLVIGLAEVLIAIWVIGGHNPRLCAAVQTVALLSMNILELIFARQHLLAPSALLPINLLFLEIGRAHV